MASRRTDCVQRGLSISSTECIIGAKCWVAKMVDAIYSKILRITISYPIIVTALLNQMLCS